MKMKTPNVFACAALVTIATLLIVPTAFGQDAIPNRTPDGQPDIQGVWTNFDSTPFETPGPEVWQDLDALAIWFPGINKPAGRIEGPSPFSVGSEVSSERSESRRSMVVDPPDGRVRILSSARAVRDDNLRRLADSWEHHTPWERCITRGVPGVMFPTYNTGHLILQPPGYVVIVSEMIHAARVIPLDGRPPLPSGVRQWDGDARGRWEGNTLIVEVTHYNTQGTVGTNVATRRLRGIPQSEALRVVERFTPIDERTIRYEVTVEDPEAFERPWTVEMPLNRSPDYRLFEYACHEGNYGLENSLRAGRADDDDDDEAGGQ